ATLAAGGEYAKPHVIKRIINGNQVTQAKVDRHQVLTPDEAAEVDYAMSFDMGSIGTANGLGLTNGQTVIAKTGTTNLSQAAFVLLSSVPGQWSALPAEPGADAADKLPAAAAVSVGPADRAAGRRRRGRGDRRRYGGRRHGGDRRYGGSAARGHPSLAPL